MTPRRIRPPLSTPAESPEVRAARSLTAAAQARLAQSAAFQQLEPVARAGLLTDLERIRSALAGGPARSAGNAPVRPLDTVGSLRDRLGGGASGTPLSPMSDDGVAPATPTPTPAPASGQPRPAATDTLARRAGALSDEIDFPAFVAGLVHGTFDAIVDSAIRQMESFAELVGAVARNTEDFTRDNVSDNQARDWLLQRYPAELEAATDPETHQAQLRARHTTTEDGESEPTSPAWLADFGLAGEELTDELISDRLVPSARKRVGDQRLQTLATLVLLGLNRVVVRDGSISARVRFRAAARDVTGVTFSSNQDGGGTGGWSTRGSNATVTHDTKISTVGVNVQAESDLKAELFGEVKINFVSETLPLDRFVDQARLTLLQGHARPVTNALARAGTPAEAPSAATPPPVAP